MNVCVCKAKMEQWQSIVEITDQVIEFAPENLKCWYWRGKANMMIEEFPEAIKCFKKALEIDPKHVQSKQDLAQTIKLREKEKENFNKKFSKMYRRSSTCSQLPFADLSPSQQSISSVQHQF